MTCHARRLRCPICANPDWHDRATLEECTHCRLRVAGPATLAEARRAIPERLAGGYAGALEGDRWSLSPLAWRDAAWRFGYTLGGDRASPAVPRGHSITLAVMTYPAQAAMAAELVAALAFDRMIVAIDADDPAPWAEMFPGATVIARRLAGDYAAQRNRLQQAAGEGWVLQLDSDEWPDAALLAGLGWLCAAADRDGLRSLGLARRNIVDGRMSALYPDIQYRLNRADIRYAGVVHERPVVPFEQTSLALVGAIEHRLDAARVRARTTIYAGLSADGARPEDEERLLRPFDAIADR